MMVFLVVSLAGFRGDISRKPPLEVFPDMDRQPKLRPMEPNGFFKNGMSSQPLVEGTVARSEAIDLGEGKKVYPFEKDHVVVSGFASGTNTVASIPIPVTSQLMARGRTKYNISCLPCHGGQGDGNGVVKYFGFGAIKDLHDPNVVKLNDGQLYRAITVGNLEGEGEMKGYANTLDVTDRWAVVAYVRALQLSRLGKEGEVPKQFHVKAKPEEEEKH
jgi:hypothetical protein